MLIGDRVEFTGNEDDIPGMVSLDDRDEIMDCPFGYVVDMFDEEIVIEFDVAGEHTVYDDNLQAA